MKFNFYFAFAIVSAALPVLAQDKPNLADHNQRINYAFGMDIVSTLKRQEFDIDLDAFLAGMRDSLNGNPALTAGQKEAAMKELLDILQANEAARRKIMAAEDLKAGEAFLAANAKKDGVQIKEVTAPDGSKAELQYKILKSGLSGPSPKNTDIVEVHYAGSLIDGTEFDSSIKRGTPATFGLDQVIPGWAEALKMMKTGDEWEIFIPTKLAYKEFGPPEIPPDSALIFDIQLLSFYTPKQATNAPASTTSATN
jgi:FKBP-type peptidyl-prolyl cis-trans isomerase